MNVVEMYALADTSLSGGYSNEGTLDVKTNISLVFFCVTLCLKNPQCMSLFYSSVTYECRLHNNVFFNTATYVMESGWHYYRTTGDPGCSVSSGFAHQRELGLCYYIHSDLVTKTEADNACTQKNADLAILDSQQKQDVVTDTLKLLQPAIPTATPVITVEPVLEGCYLLGNFDSRSLEFSNLAITVQMCFDVCQPLGRTHTALENKNKCYCGDLQMGAAKQSDTFCNDVCSDGKWCGKISTVFATYSHHSMSVGGTSYAGFYIGAMFDAGAAQWIWRNTTPLSYDAFDAGDDDTTSETCAVMASSVDYKWYSEECSFQAGYVCEIDL